MAFSVYEVVRVACCRVVGLFTIAQNSIAFCDMYL